MNDIDGKEKKAREEFYRMCRKNMEAIYPIISVLREEDQKIDRQYRRDIRMLIICEILACLGFFAILAQLAS